MQEYNDALCATDTSCTRPLFLLAVLALSSCSKPVDLPKALEVTDVTTGYFDAGIVEGNKNKIVPTISFRLKNIVE